MKSAHRLEPASNAVWYVDLEAPLPLAQAVGSPIPPPRQRINPFNKPENSPHQRSQSLRTASIRLEESSSRHENSTNKVSISFWELHNSYGRPILSDFNAWKHEQRKIQERIDNLSGNLINL